MKNQALNTNSPTGIIILAAGASKRMGKPKQLLKTGNTSLIERTINVATHLPFKPIIAVVLGANFQKIQPIIPLHNNVFVVENQQWHKGMGTSLKKGLSFLIQKDPLLQSVIVLVCDQPYLNVKILAQLIETFEQNKSEIIASKYGDTIGVPALFSRKVFSDLLKLNKDEGARKIIKKNRDKVVSIDFEKGIFDLDTPEAYQQYQRTEARKRDGKLSSD